MKIKIVNKSPNDVPAYATPGAAGFDLRAHLDMPIIIAPMERVLVPTGLYFEIPYGYEAQIRPRSGLALKNGITVLNTPGTLDSDYRGECKVILINLSLDEFTVLPGDRIAQMVIAQHATVEFDVVPDVENMSTTERGAGGFSSTGVK